MTGRPLLQALLQTLLQAQLQTRLQGRRQHTLRHALLQSRRRVTLLLLPYGALHLLGHVPGRAAARRQRSAWSRGSGEAGEMACGEERERWEMEGKTYDACL